MATDLLSADVASSPPPELPVREQPQSTICSALEPVLRPLASLKLTVALFGLAVFLVFAGTLAQARHDVWWVVYNYFRTWLAWIEFQVFFPPAWFPNLQNISGGFWFPGFYVIGGLMGLNLLAAHGLRFKVQAQGARLWSGLGIIAVGCLLTWRIITAGPGEDGQQATMPIEWKTLWQWFLMGLAVTCVGIAGALFVLDSKRKAERTLLMGAGTLLLALLAFLLFAVDVSALNSDSMLSSMRILWQIVQAGFASLVLLAGCILVFRKRAGVVLLHAGVGLIMLNEVNVDLMHKESQMTIFEGETANYATDIRTFEVAVIDPSYSDTEDDVTVAPEELVRESMAEGKPITHSDLLPFDIQIQELYENAEVRDAKPGDELIANSGIGRDAVLVPQRLATGSDTNKHNYPGAYVKLFDKTTGNSLGTFLLSALMQRGEQVEVGGKKYEVALRFQRDYKPFALQLLDVRADQYPGTNIPQNYSSDLQVVDPTRNTDRRVKIRMNEPWRYAGDTFYQSGYHPPGETGAAVEATTLQVVSNFGWMIPYMACMIVGTGMLAHFSLILIRFLRRRESVVSVGNASKSSDGGLFALLRSWHDAGKARRTDELQNRKKRADEFAPLGGFSATAGAVLPIAVVLFAVGLLTYMAVGPQAKPQGMDLAAFGRLPIMYGGRVQPVDTLARNSLRMISLRERFVDANDEYQPAVKWLLDVIARPNVGQQHHIFRIDNPDVLSTLGLDRRKYFRYSWNEVSAGRKEFDKARKAAEDRDDASYTVYEKKLAELNERIFLYQLMDTSFRHRPIPEFPTEAEFKANPKAVEDRILEIRAQIVTLPNLKKVLDDFHPPLAVPPRQSAEGEWQPYSVAWMTKYLDEIQKQPVNKATLAWEKIFDAYAEQDAEKFNQAVADYAALVQTNSPEQLSEANPAFEAWFNAWGPFGICQWLYFAAFCFAALAWLGWSGPLNRTAFWLIALTFVAHTFALCARMYISGRPPVTNLYSSAIFIGWAAVLSGLILEKVYRLGFGNVLASTAGFATLMIADKLSLMYDGTTRGDMVGVMQAVLDTQFWLATHVTCITLGYTATFVAGLLGLNYVVRGVFTPLLSADEGKSLARMMYGTVCFGIFFSFVGTVLGGLWADDSWGRFWGWDPKENGALIIVLWNALILHARWDGLVKDRGLAVLAIGGNIVTSWSWFGVNQLGVGLHSYGFTEGVLLALGIFCVSQIAMIGVGLLPLKYWLSNRASATHVV